MLDKKDIYREFSLTAIVPRGSHQNLNSFPKKLFLFVSDGDNVVVCHESPLRNILKDKKMSPKLKVIEAAC